MGLALAETHLAARFNKPDAKIVDHYTYTHFPYYFRLLVFAPEYISIIGMMFSFLEIVAASHSEDSLLFLMVRWCNTWCFVA